MLHNRISITVNGKPVHVESETTVAAAMLMAGEPCRRSVSGEWRAPLCGIGICMECRVTAPATTTLKLEAIR